MFEMKHHEYVEECALSVADGSLHGAQRAAISGSHMFMRVIVATVVMMACLGAGASAQNDMTVTSVTAMQDALGPISVGAANQVVIRIDITTEGYDAPIYVTNFDLSTNASTATADITAARVYYTGTVNQFSTAIPFGMASLPDGAFSVSGSQALWTGTNYFWVAYDISAGATRCNVVDASCSSITLGPSIYTQAAYTTGAPWSPAGTQFIEGPMSGTYTIDSRISPAQCRTYACFNDAIRDLLAYGVDGPVTINVATGSGPYTEHVSIPSIQGASATNTITFQGNGEILQSVPTSVDYSLVDFKGAKYVTIDNIYIKCSAISSSTYGVLLRNQAEFVRIINCTIDLSNSSEELMSLRAAR
jgi:hypothetical protein